jgi:hypothetical protein
MEAIHIHNIVEKDGEIFVKGLPCKHGQHVEMIVLIENSDAHSLTARRLRHSGLIGLWKDRKDIEDSVSYARQLREKAQRRRE